MRIAILVATTILFATQTAWADIVRHSTIPSAFTGTWAASSDACQKNDGSAIALSGKRYANSESRCRVDWVDEIPALQGPIYSAHLRCTSRARPASKSISNVVLSQRDGKQISMGSDLYSLRPFERCPAR